MANDYPDYGVYGGLTPVATIIDRAELAARLDSINVFDRRGFTVWQDDFEAPSLRWTPIQQGVGVLPVLSTATAFSGVQSVLFDAPAGMLSESTIRRYFPLLRLGRIGVEFWIQSTAFDTQFFRIWVRIYDGALPSWVELWYDPFNSTISITTTVGLVPIVTDVYMQTTNFYFLPIKLVVDMDTDQYIRLMVGDREFDISAYFIPVAAASANRYIFTEITLISNVGVDALLYLDNFILTQNEP